MMREGHGLDAIGRLIAQCEATPRGRQNADLVADARAELNAYRAMVRLRKALDTPPAGHDPYAPLAQPPVHWEVMWGPKTIDWPAGLAVRKR